MSSGWVRAGRFAFRYRGLLLPIAIVLLLAFRDIEPTLVQVALAAGACVLAFLGIAYIVKPFNADERAAVNRVLTRPLFQW